MLNVTAYLLIIFSFIQTVDRHFFLVGNSLALQVPVSMLSRTCPDVHGAGMSSHKGGGVVTSYLPFGKGILTMNQKLNFIHHTEFDRRLIIII